MNAEQNLPESHVALAPPPPSSSEENGSSAAPGSSQNKSRRRRRKRKGRSASAEGQAPQAGQAEGVTASDGSGESAPAPQQQPQQQAREQRQASQNANQNNANGSSQGKRWKKKHRRAGDGQPRPEPGNSLQGSNSGGTNRGRGRKQQSRGPRAFVGPMDHSYREVNGNYADVPQSTIEMHGNTRRNNGRSGRTFNEDRLPPELLSNHRPVTIPENAPTHIYFFIEDLFFTAKIQESARQQGVKVAFMKPDKDIVAHLSELHDHEHPSLIVFDLNNAAAKPLTLIPKLKAKLKKGTSIVGFLSHLQGDLKAKAMEAGCNSVMPRAAFSQNLPNLLRRYGVEDEHEPNYNM